MGEGFIRPEPRVLPERSLIPSASLIQPPPNRFTHATVGRTPFSYKGIPGEEATADGSFPGGTRVVLLRADEDGRAGVVDASGLYVVVASSSLRPLEVVEPTG